MVALVPAPGLARLDRRDARGLPRGRVGVRQALTGILGGLRQHAPPVEASQVLFLVVQTYGIMSLKLLHRDKI